MDGESVLNLSEEIDRLKMIIIEKEKTFSEKRAQFKELYMKKEDELKILNSDYSSAIQDAMKWKEEADCLKNEIEDIRNASLLSDSLREEEVDQMRNKYQEEFSKLEKTMLDNIATISHREEEMKDRLDKAEMLNKGENMLTRIAQRVRVNTQEVMRVWKEEGLSQAPCGEEMLRSVVQPYEEDVQMLKDKIRQAYTRIDELEAQIRLSEMNNDESVSDGHVNDVLASSHVTIIKCQSGNDLTSCNDDTVYRSISARRHTDAQSLDDYHTADPVSNDIKSRTVSENEWSRLHLELSALKTKSSGICEMCKNYEDQLQSLQNQFKTQAREYNELSDDNQANLRLIVSIRESNNKLTCQLNDAVTVHETIIADLSTKYNNLNEFCDKIRTAYERFRDSTDRELKNIVNERREVKLKMERIESVYEHLLGIRGKKAADMEAEKIDLPTDIETAQFSLLRLREELIQIKSANEHLNEKIQSLEIFGKEKDKADNAEKEATIEEYNNEIKELQAKVDHLTQELTQLRMTQKNSENLDETVRILKTELDTVKKNYSNIENENRSIKKKSQALKLDLENSESVQQDFVRLSQTLQIQLEKLRQEEKELRWQFKDDVVACNDCHLDLQGNNYWNKYNCQHCGKVFCKACLTEIQAGANGRKADVCKVCHTMLVKDAVPYFSINKP